MIVNVAFCPAFIDAGPTLVIDTSAEVVTVVVAVAELLAAFASVVELVTFAVLVIVVPGATPGLTLTTMVNVAVCPAARVGRVAVTVPVPPAAGAVVVRWPVPVNDTNVVPAGTRSVIDTFCGSLGPLFATVIV